MPATTITPLADGLWGLEDEVSLPGGARLPLRSTVVALGDGSLALFSPIAMAEAAAAAVAKLGRVQFIIAPSALHHLYVKPALTWFPSAKLYAPQALARKRKDLQIDGFLSQGVPLELNSSCSILTLNGNPTVQESVLLHKPTGTLLVSDLLFNITQPRGRMSHFVLALTGANGRLAQSRLWSFYAKDKAAFKASTKTVFEWSWDRLVPCHGDVVPFGAKDAANAALRWK